MILYEGVDVLVRTSNSSKVYHTGSTHPTHNCGIVTVLAQEVRVYLNKKGHKRAWYFIIEFADGTKVQAEAPNIKKGTVVNPCQPSVYGRGFPGQGKWKMYINGKKTKEYQIWTCMLRRCYDKDFHRDCPTYKECSVDSRWYNFQLFCEDIKEIKGHKEWKEDNNERNKYDFDKDIKVQGNKTYSLDTCIFVSHKENMVKAHITGVTYIGTRLSDGYVEVFLNQSEFARKYSLTSSGISRCILGKCEKYKGWTFREEEVG